MSTFNAGAIEARLTLNRTAFSRELRAARAQADRFDRKAIDITVNLETGGAFAELQALMEMGGRNITLNVDVDSGAALTELSAVDEAASLVDGRAINMNVDVDMAAAEAQLATLEAEVSTLDGKAINIDVNVDRDTLTSLVGSGGGGGSGGGSMGLLQMALVALAVLSPIVAVATSAAGAAIVALASALVGAAGALGIFGLAAYGAYKEFKKWEKAGRELTPWMQFFKGALDDLKSAWKDFIRLTRNDTFAVMGLGLHILADALPILAKAVHPISEALITIMNGISDWVNGPGFRQFVKFFAGFGSAALIQFSRILGDLFQILMRVFRGIAPFAIQMLDGLATSMDGWVRGLRDLQHNKGFQEWLDNARYYGPMVLEMLGAFVEAIVNIGDALRPFAEPMLKGLTALFQLIAEAPTKVLTILIGVFAGVWAAIAFGIPMLEGIVALFALISAPVLIVVGALALLGLALYDLWTNNQKFHDAVVDTWNHIVDVILPIIQSIVDYVRSHWDEIKQTTLDTWNSFVDMVGSALEAVMAIINRALDVIQFIWNHWGTQIMQIVGALFKTVFQMLRGAFQVIKGIFEIFTGILTGDWDKVWQGIKDVVHGAITGMTAILRNFGPLVLQLIKDALSGLAGLISDKIGDVVQAVRDMPGKIRDIGGAMLEAGKHVIGQFVEGLKNIGVIGGLADDVFSAITGAIGNVLHYIVDQLNIAMPDSIEVPGPNIPLPDNPIPNPFAEGGVVTRPTLAMIGEGGESEAVVPLSRLDDWIDKVARTGLDSKSMRDAFIEALATFTQEGGFLNQILLRQNVYYPVAEPASIAGQNALASLANGGLEG